MSTQIATSVNKNFCSSFNAILANYPIVGRIANAVLFGELLTDEMVLVFGDYDLVLCYQEDGSEDVYHTEVINRVFAEPIPLKTGVSSFYAQALQVQVHISAPLQVRIRAGKPSKLKFWDLVKSMISDLTWVEVQVEGKITIEVALPQEAVPVRCLAAQAQDGDRCGQRDSLLEVKKTEAVKKDEEITISLDALADLALQMIQRRERERGEISSRPSGTGAEAESLSDASGRITGENEPAEQDAPRMVDQAMLEELVQRIIREHGEIKPGQEVAVQATEKAQVTLPPPAPVSLNQIALGQIPSRPGLWKTFGQEVPPPRPSSDPPGAHTTSPGHWHGAPPDAGAAISGQAPGWVFPPGASSPFYIPEKPAVPYRH
ncbi:MAG: hypothetical protein ABSC17_04530 [Thermacetogeniaceae bacterium]